MPCPGADGRSSELRRCLAEAMAFVETPWAAGSGVLLADGYVVTNAHVVDPYDRATLTFDGGESFRDVEVVGIDAFADVAVLGPVEVDHPGVTLEPIPDYAEEDEPEVFLVGFPGGVEGDDPSISLSSGVFSRLREDATFGHTYVQTDAAIAGGQSGGALVDGDGRLLGISGLGFAEEFALALSAGDVAESVERIVAGDGDERRVMPTVDTAGSEPTTVSVSASALAQAVIPSSGTAREVRLTVDAERPVGVDVSTFQLGSIGVNDVAREIEEEVAEELGETGPGFYEGVPELDEPEPGTYAFEVPADEDVFVLIGGAAGPHEVTVSADAPMTVFEGQKDVGPLEVGRPVRGLVDGFSWEAVHTLELDEGDEIEVVVHAGTADAYFTLLAPGETYDPYAGASADDGGGGLYDLDPQGTFTIDESGTWRLVVGTYDGVVSGYEVTVLSTG